jgi:hypothetical protein
MNLPVGTIILWDNAGTIPSGWQICNGTNGTPNMVGSHVRGANDDSDLKATGGGGTHSHANSNTNDRAAHNHGGSANCNGTGSATASTVVGNTGDKAAATHTHSGGSVTVSSANAHPHTLGSTGNATYDPYHIGLIFIQRIS